MRRLLLVLICITVVVVAFKLNAKGKDGKMLTAEANLIIDEYVSKYKPLDLEGRAAWFKYGTTGDKKASDKEAAMQMEIRKLNSDKMRFAKLKELFDARKKIDDPLIRRQIELLYLGHLPNQISEDKLKKLTELEKSLKEKFNDYQPIVDGKKLSPVDVDHILADSKDSAYLEKVWKAKYSVGPTIEKDYRDLVKLRNEIARDLGYNNALDLAAEVSEMNLKMLDKFYADVANASDKAFQRLKDEYIDPRLAERYAIKVSELRPWHYQNAFFQEAPNAIFGKVDLDELYKKVDANKAIKQTEDFYASMGIDVASIVKRSSLFPKPGKNPHAVAWALDLNNPDSSVLIMNLPNPPKDVKASEVSTMVHELGHDVNYTASIGNEELSYLLKDVSMLTEAFAMLMEQQTQTSDWFKKLGVPADKATETSDAVALIDYVDQLLFLHWSSTIYCFEKNFYNNPDQDIGDLWWSCKGKNQLETRPEGWKNPDALAKYHIPNVSPLYYSNYAIGRVANVQFGEIFASKINENPRGASYFDKKNLGEWMMSDFLAQGQRYKWDDDIKRTTGKPLSVDAWKKFYIDSGVGEKLYK